MYAYYWHSKFPDAWSFSNKTNKLFIYSIEQKLYFKLQVYIGTLLHKLYYYTIFTVLNKKNDYLSYKFILIYYFSTVGQFKMLFQNKLLIISRTIRDADFVCFLFDL